MWDGPWSGFFFGPIMMIESIAAALVAVVLLVGRLGASGHGGVPHAPSGKTALDILKERLARGESDAEEFEQRRRALAD